MHANLGKISMKFVPEGLVGGGVNTGQMEVDVFFNFLHLKRMKINPIHIRTNTNKDKTIIAMVLAFNF